MAKVQDIFDEIPERFNPEAAAGQNLIFQFDITDGDSYYLAIDDGRCEVVSGTHDNPNITMIASSETFIAMMTGEMDSMQAFMDGHLKTEGNMMLATKLNDFLI